MNDVLLEVSELSLRYGTRKILESASYEVRKGTLNVIAGPSGSGKSSLLYILGGFLRPHSGSYRFREIEPYRRYRLGFGMGTFRRRYIGFLFQDFRLLPFLNVEQNIRFPMYFTGNKLTSDQLRSLLESLGIWHRRKAKPSEISGGEAQRTGLGRALLLRPELLLLDEPTGNLDGSTEEEILQLLLQLRDQGITLICVTHSPQIMASADTVNDLKDLKLIPRIRNVDPAIRARKTRSKA